MMRMIKKILVLLILPAVILSACNNSNENGQKKPKEVKLKRNEAVVNSYVNGTPQVVRKMEEIDGQKVAVYEKEYYEDGNILKEGPLTNNQRSGEWKIYYRNGQIRNLVNYDNGVLNDTIIGYNENGTLKFKGIFKDGQKTGTWLIFDDNGKFLENRVYMKPGEKRMDTLYMPE